jgi:hypothetical protein
MHDDSKRGALAAGLAALVLGSGCATMKPMALSKETQAIPLDAQQSLALAAVKVANVYKTGYQPHIKDVRVKATGGKAGEEAEVFAFTVVAPYRASADETNQFEEILVSLALAPGEYEMSGVRVAAGSFLMPGNGMVPVNATFRIPPGKAVYLGRIEATRRERTGDEPRAGPVIPLIDQAVTGFSGGTFEVKLYDGYDHDLPLMRAEYPALQNVPVEKAFMTAKPPETPAPQPKQE